MTGAAIELHWSSGELEAVMGAVHALETFGGARSEAMWAAIGGYGVSSTQLRFDQQHGPDGDPWKPSRRAIKEDNKTLVWHGLLLASLTFNATRDGVEWGSPLEYAAAMQGGASFTIYARSQQIYRRAGRDGIEPGFVKKSKSNFATWATIPACDETGAAYDVTIPARPYLGLNAEDGQEVVTTVLDHVDMAWKGTVH